MITLQQASKFAAIRNKAEFHNNLQFGIDCQTAGFKGKDLGDPTKIEEGWYEWSFPWGKLIEKWGVMTYEVTP